MKNSYKRGPYILAASIFALAVAIGLFAFRSDDSEAIANIESEKIVLIEELEDMSFSYAQLLEESDENNEALEEAKSKIDVLIDSLETNTVNLKSLLQLKGRQLEMQNVMTSLIEENNKLKENNGLLTHTLHTKNEQLMSTKSLLESANQQKLSLEEEKERLNEKVDKMSFLNLVDFNVTTLKVRSSGRHAFTNKARQVEKIKVCYTIAKNPLLSEGSKDLYIQIVGPRQLIVSPKWKRFKDEKVELNYTATTSFDYENDNINECEYVIIDTAEKLKKGTYTVNIFDRASLITNYKVELK
ncbi:MAG: hypothetical protein HKN40_04675 [Winogradskyella sp.]|uniref:hypothetical protein n=1 Tax=Winogradskyella sp. TaxID=1883156 RepID=UPI0017DB7885|nr:hypothetical protein [Winogradskyella sp.]